MVNCLIYNVEDGSGVKGEDDVLLWGEQGEDGTCTPKPLAIPADFAWEQGKKYIYTIVFGNGNGGYDPEDPDPNPDPVLVPISFEVEVDDFCSSLLRKLNQASKIQETAATKSLFARS